MRSVGRFLEIFSIKTITVIAFILLTVITWWTALYTCYYSQMLEYTYSTYEPMIILSDSPCKNLAVTLAVFVFFGFLSWIFFQKKDEKQRTKFVWFFAVLEIMVVGILLTIWVTITQFEQQRDAGIVYNITQEFLQGNYSSMKLNYIQYYQHQLNLTFIEEIILKLGGDFRIFQYFNVVFILGIIFFLYRITDKMFHNQTINFYCLMSVGGFLPMHFYVTLVYGDICSIALGLMAIWALLAWCDTKKKRYIAVTVFGLTVATLVRKNTIILIIAIFICLFIYVLREREWRGVLIGLLISATIFSFMKFIPYQYEKRSGVELGDAMPAILWIAMGTQWDYGAYGVYNGANESLFWWHGQNTEEASKAAKDIIKENIQVYIDDPAFCLEFYRNKMLEQWGETTYGGMYLTYEGEGQRESKIVDAVYKSPLQKKLMGYQNHHAFVVYFFTILFLVMAIIGKKFKNWIGFDDSNNIWHYLLLIIIVGGILFSIIWEAKSRYVFGYVIFMIPYMACGVLQLQITLKRVVARIVKTIRKMQR